ncbi:MAG: hypothetical protein JSW06_09160 [Thermoplasmatales archaeon]|nr:MAG: hypothetical protein JSW06_09160 [Thermoplasmatales archaeon]
MKNKPRHEILNDIIKDSKKFPNGWKAAFGKDNKLLSNDCYILNPNIGIYLLKEYQKNPFQLTGIGTKIARRIDEEIEDKINKNSSDFGIIQGNIQKIIKNIDKGIHPQKIFEEGVKGNDLGITIPIKGKASTSENTFNYLQQMFALKQKKFNEKFEKIASDDGLYSSYD